MTRKRHNTNVLCFLEREAAFFAGSHCLWGDERMQDGRFWREGIPRDGRIPWSRLQQAW